jgi:hypothetical protein
MGYMILGYDGIGGLFHEYISIERLVTSSSGSRQGKTVGAEDVRTDCDLIWREPTGLNRWGAEAPL